MFADILIILGYAFLLFYIYRINNINQNYEILIESLSQELIDLDNECKKTIKSKHNYQKELLEKIYSEVLLINKSKT